MQKALFSRSRELTVLGRRALESGDSRTFGEFLRQKNAAQQLVEATEKVWDFYFRVFSQRQTRLGALLIAADRISLDCYQAVFLGLGAPRSIPSPAPFSYMHGERGAATFRRGVAISLLGQRANPFPLIKLPYHRLLNAQTLSAVPHEVAHNIQADLGLWTELPKRLTAHLIGSGIPPTVARVWSRWHKEVFADLCGVLLIGPPYVPSLMSVVARPRLSARRFRSSAVHPTPFLRPLIALGLVRRMGFAGEARRLARNWVTLYPGSDRGEIPRDMARTFSRAADLVVDTVCFTRYPQLGGRTLAQVLPYGKKEQAMTGEAAARLAAGTDPGVIPERFLIGAARIALDAQLARPGQINTHFYEALSRR